MAAHETKASAPAAQAPAASGAAAPAEGQVNTHVVQVGAGGLTFSPSNVIAQPGDLVQFQFNPKNHSVVQSTFDNPCIPIQNILANKTDAFFSGFMPTAVNSTAKPLTYTIRVMDTKPVWFYCSQAKHCQSGMVGAINAATSGNKTVAAFAGLAAVAVENLSPGQAPGQAAASGAPGAAASSGAAPAGEGAATGTGGLVASTSSPSNPAQQTTNAAPGRLSDVGRQSFLGLGLGGLAAFIVL
ncbi:Cupredoxin [Melanomma pulvis-pyrius CBS 109.77]|uniref:Cupredoxin n=1 Tax=Melanomma pulvis-pyrius CBS 109.77 TaxID=1314802 RepID=A0A6A6XL14_9PLEO|nr:Cupredoxin [Melanomma pulvis-pyrius CBS 109.77]